MQQIGNNESGLAVVLDRETPSTFDVLQTLQQKAERRRLQEQELQKREEARKGALIAYLGQNFDERDFDNLLHQKIAESKSKYAQMVRQNPGMDIADLATLVQNDMSKLSGWNSQVKTLRDQIKSGAESYKQYKGIDSKALEKLALHDALFNRGEDGSVALKSPDELDIQKDYVGQAFDKYGKMLQISEPDINEMIKKLPTSKYGDSYRVTNNLRGHEAKKFSAEIYPFQQLIRDKSGEYHVSTKFKPVPGTEEKLDSNGQPLYKMADDDTYNWYLQSPETRLQLNNDYDSYALSKGMVDTNGRPFDRNSPEGDVIKRMFVYDLLDGKAQKSIVRESDRAANPLPIKLINQMYGVGGSSGTGDKKQRAPHPIDVLFGAISGDPKIAEAGAKTDYGQVNILPLMKRDWKFTSRDGKNVTASKIVYDPARPGDGFTVFWNETEKVKTRTGTKSKTTEKSAHYGAQDAKEFVEQSMNQNSAAMKTNYRAFEDWVDGEGNYKFDLPTAPPRASVMDHLFMNLKRK